MRAKAFILILFGLVFAAAILVQAQAPLTDREVLISRQEARPAPAAVPEATKPRVVAAYGKLPLSFEANQGQTDDQVKFLSRGCGYTLFLTADEAVLALRKPSPSNDHPAAKPQTGGGIKHPAPPGSRTPGETDVVRMKLLGANHAPEITGAEQLPGKSNYFIGNDPAKWRTNVPHYAKVKYHGIYPGIDLVYYGNQGQLEHDFIVAPGADPEMIRLEVEGVEGLGSQPNVGSSGALPINVDTDGGLVITTQGGVVRFHKPVVYQPSLHSGRRDFVDARYVLLASEADNSNSRIAQPKIQVGFGIAAYDRSKQLIIDPVLSYSTYLGGSSFDFVYGIAVDAAGSAYVTGSTWSTDFPLANPLQATNAGYTDAFVTKLNPEGSDPVFSTYLGGSSYDESDAIAVDAGSSAYVTGSTWSTDFPLANPLQDTYEGGDAFVAKLNADGSALVFSTYLGGSGQDDGSAIAVDAVGNAHVSGETVSKDFPLVNPLQATHGGGYRDIFVAKLDSAGSGLVFSTYLGGSDEDFGRGVAVDGDGSTYVTGRTYSPDFPLANPLQGVVLGTDAFVAKLNPDGSALVFSTYLGGSGADWGWGIAVDAAGSAYVTGSTDSTDFPVANPLQATNAGYEDAFVTKLNADGSALVFSTYLGGSLPGWSVAIAVDAASNAYVTGETYSPDFPVANPLQATNAGYRDAFVARLHPAGSTLVFSTYLGGSAGDAGWGIAVDAAGRAYVTGRTSSTDFPVVNPLQASQTGCEDAFVVKVAPGDNTPAGLEVLVPLTDDVTVTFDSVIASGTTALTRTTSGPHPPTGFQLGRPPTYYYMSTTASYTGLVTVCIDYSGMSFPTPLSQTLIHWLADGTSEIPEQWKVPETTIICARVDSLSPFAIVSPVFQAQIQPPIDVDGSSVFSARRGVVPVKFTLTWGGEPTCDLPPATISLSATAASMSGPVNETDYMTGADSGSEFRISECQYIYNLSTSSLGPGSYRVEIKIGEEVVGSGTFALK